MGYLLHLKSEDPNATSQILIPQPSCVSKDSARSGLSSDRNELFMVYVKVVGFQKLVWNVGCCFLVVVVVVMGLMVKGTRILVVDPPKSWLRVPQKVMPRNPDKLAYAKWEVDISTLLSSRILANGCVTASANQHIVTSLLYDRVLSLHTNWGSMVSAEGRKPMFNIPLPITGPS